MSASILGQVVFMLSCTGFVDRTPHAKRLLVILAAAGAVFTIWLGKHAASTPDSGFVFPALLFLLASSCYGAVSVCRDAFLPRLSSQTYHMQQARILTEPDRFQGAFEAPEPVVLESEVQAVSRISTTISSAGASWGYLAALLAHILTVLIAQHTKRTAEAISCIGWWWLLFQPVVIQGLDSTQLIDEFYTRTTFLELLAHGWIQLLEVLRHVQRLKDIALFLLGWLLLSGALNTINSTAILFAKVNLGMKTPQLALIGLITIVFALFGAVASGRFLPRHYAMVYISLISAVIPIYGLLGFFSWPIGLKHAWEMYLMAAWYGCVLGALQSVSRALYTVLIPEGGEATFFAFYAVSGKASSVFGPVITGVVTQYMHDIRYGFYFLFVVIGLSAYAFSFVDLDRGRDDASEYNILDYNQLSISLPADEF